MVYMSWFDDVCFDCCFSFFGYEQFTYKLDFVFFSVIMLNIYLLFFLKVKCMKAKHQFINETKFFEVKIVPDYFNQQEINDLNKVLVNSLKKTKYFANITDNLVVLNETARLSLNEEIRNVLNNSVVASVNKVRLFVLNNSIINRLNGQNEPIMTGIDKIFQDKRLDKMYYNVFFVMNEIVQSSLNETLFAALNQTILNFLNNKVVDALTAHQVILRNETNKAIVITIENVQTELNSKLLDTLYNKVIVAIEDKISAYLKNKREEDLKLMG